MSMSLMDTIEAKAAGLPLIQELRASGIPVQDYLESRPRQAIAS